jgi:hypothetical protein
MAGMIDIDDFLPQVLLYAPNCNDLVAHRFIRESAREWCERTKCWRENDEISIVAPECEGVTTFGDAEIVEIQRARMDDYFLEAKTIAWLDDHKPGWDMDEDVAQPAYVTQIRPDTVSIYPRATGTLKVRFILKPSIRATTLPDFLLSQWGTEIGKGAAGKLLKVGSGDVAANPAFAVDLLNEFETALNRQDIKVAKGQQGAPLRTKGRYL